MLVYKFGGASIKDINNIKNMAGIVNSADDSNGLLLVISAMGKTTNALEEVVNAYCNKDYEIAKQLFKTIETQHNAVCNELLNANKQNALDKLDEIYSEAEWILNDDCIREKNYYYDQIVCLGELMSTTIVSNFFNEENITNSWCDARSIIKTDDNYKDPILNWTETEANVNSILQNLFTKTNIVVTQGFIGSTAENESVTLGREGSDYSGAVLANLLNAESLSIWKDVKGLLNADPKIFDNTVEIKEISFHEVIEMAYYGAQVIHPKTIKPLQNKNIPLYVKCFLDASLEGTAIKSEVENISYPPIFVLKKNQTLIQFTTLDFSFITEDSLSELYEIFHELRIKINLIQNAAISFVACIDNIPEKVEQLIERLSNHFKVLRNDNVLLYTVRHYNDEAKKLIRSHGKALLVQKTRSTLQAVVKE